jgi:hypothetical protein
MAVLPSRLQDILYARLQRYNCVSKEHPKRLAKYGGVAICSGGCYKSIYDWRYLDTSLFRVDFTDSDSWPLIFEVKDAPACYLANGPYLRTSCCFNNCPVYAQITQLELLKEKGNLKQFIANATLDSFLSSTAQNFGHKSLRAGERLLVRNPEENGWLVQSVSAYRGFSKIKGSCGFHVLKISDETETTSATCFADLTSDHEQLIMEDCGAVLIRHNYVASDFHPGSKFCFSFGSRRVAQPVVQPGTKYTPYVTRHQQCHTDSKTEHDGADAMWKEDGKVDWKSDAFRLSYLSTLSVDELQNCCRTRNIPIPIDEVREDHQRAEQERKKKDELIFLLGNWLETNATTIPVPSNMLDGASALFAFFTKTALGVPCSVRAGSRNWSSLKLSIPIGTAVLFRFDFLHHGWRCSSEDGYPAGVELPVHFRAHFYLLSSKLSALPMANFEALLEFLSVSSLESMDVATQLLMLECLQTFVPWAKPYEDKNFTLKPLDDFAKSRKYTLFESQDALDEYCIRQHHPDKE